MQCDVKMKAFYDQWYIYITQIYMSNVTAQVERFN